MIGRRRFLAALAAAPFVAPLQAQPGVRRVAIVGVGDPAVPPLSSFIEALRDFGYIEGKNLEILRPVPGDDPDGKGRARLATVAVERKAEVIFAWGTTAARAVRKVTKNIPVVVQAGSDPVEAGLVRNLARPEGNVTGIFSGSALLVEKRLELLKEAFPRVQRIGALSDPAAASFAQTKGLLEQAATRLGITANIVEVRDLGALRQAGEALAKAKPDALFPMPSNRFIEYRNEFVQLAATMRLPAVYFTTSFVRAGGLFSYSVDAEAMFRRAAYFVDRILKGAKPADLPFEQPTKFVLALNMRTARSLGVSIPPNVLVRADTVIQ